jgi:hypothetical protein
MLNLVVQILTTWLIDTVKTMEAYTGCSGIAPLIPNLGTGWTWVVKYTPRPLHHRRKNASTHGTGGWMAPRAGPDFSENRKISWPSRKSKRGSSSPKHSQYTGYDIPGPRLCAADCNLCNGRDSVQVTEKCTAVFQCPGVRTHCASLMCGIEWVAHTYIHTSTHTHTHTHSAPG